MHFSFRRRFIKQFAALVAGIPMAPRAFGMMPRALRGSFTEDNTMELKRNGSQASAEGPGQYFTGRVRVDQLFKAPAPARGTGAYVTFEPSARSNWHTHPLGQTLVCTSGCGLVQSWGGPVRVLRPGDVVWCPPNEKHWHGAAPTTAMTHMTIAEELDGKVVDWLEPVTDEQYRATPDTSE
jgi:quercetin dioxygenase-like cupin family protein